MKKDNQGFMLVEALVMSIVIIGVLVFMFIQFRNISRGYDTSFSYDTVPAMYYTNELKEWIITNGYLYDLEYDLGTEDYLHVVKYIEEDNEYAFFAMYIEEDDVYEELYDHNSQLESLVDAAEIKNVVIADEGLTGLKGVYNSEFSEKFNDYINYVKVNGEVNKYRIVVEFFDGTFASLRLGGE